MASAAVNLSLPATADDTMEMSSPARSPGGMMLEDQLIFDEWQPGDAAQSVNDNDRMMEDGEQTRPGTATDDMMEDDMQPGEQTAIQEAEMEDSPSHIQQHVEDEELIDYTDDENDEILEDAVPVIDAPEVAGPPAPPASTGVQDEEVDEEVPRNQDDDVLFEQSVEEVEPPAAAEAQGTAVAEEITPHVRSTSTAVHEAGTGVVSAEEGHQSEQVTHQQHDEVEEAGDAELEAQPLAIDEESSRPVMSVDTSAQTFVEGPATPTDTGLHAMTLRFGDLQCPLFKSRNQPDGLLKNDNLASLSLGELIQNCRQRLAIKTGEDVSEDQDLVLGFEQLGLLLVEVCSSCITFGRSVHD